MNSFEATKHGGREVIDDVTKPRQASRERHVTEPRSTLWCVPTTKSNANRAPDQSLPVQRLSQKREMDAGTSREDVPRRTGAVTCTPSHQSDRVSLRLATNY